jgi:hypothetical protein
VNTRAALSVGLSLAVLALAVATAGVQSHNRAEADRLARQYTTIKLIEAVNDERAAEIVALDHEPARADRKDKTDKDKHVPAVPVRKGRPAEVRVDDEAKRVSERVQRAKGVL